MRNILDRGVQSGAYLDVDDVLPEIGDGEFRDGPGWQFNQIFGMKRQPQFRFEMPFELCMCKSLNQPERDRMEFRVVIQ